MILSNAMDEQIQTNVAQARRAVPPVYTAQQAQAYKPRLQAFEYMLDRSAATPRTSCTCRRACATT